MKQNKLNKKTLQVIDLQGFWRSGRDSNPRPRA